MPGTHNFRAFSKTNCMMEIYRLTHLLELEAESIYVIREVAAQFERPVLLFSGGKDSIVMYHLARKAFWPALVPFPLLHIDTGHNFPETLQFRDELMEKTGGNALYGTYRIPSMQERWWRKPGTMPAGTYCKR